MFVFGKLGSNWLVGIVVRYRRNKMSEVLLNIVIGMITRKKTQPNGFMPRFGTDLILLDNRKNSFAVKRLSKFFTSRKLLRKSIRISCPNIKHEY